MSQNNSPNMPSHFSEHFTDFEVDNTRIKEIRGLISPQVILDDLPLGVRAKQTVLAARKEAADILHGRDDRLLVIVGPCSIHDTRAALEYASRLAAAKETYEKDLCIVMRVYFEKPRTTVGWKGLINDPFMDETYRVNAGLRIARRLLKTINQMGVPCGCEFLDTMSPQYISDLVSWAAIGARTTECQLHRELASAVSMPIGFKNSTSGDIGVAIDACLSAIKPHCFFSVTKQGTAAIVQSIGNEDSHIILRGGNNGPNYSEEHILKLSQKCESKKHKQIGVIVDCSHGNSYKDWTKQQLCLEALAEQISNDGPTSNLIAGVMIESNLRSGRQDLPSVEDAREINERTLHASESGSPITADLSGDHNPPVLRLLKYGLSVTDGCVDWETTITMLDIAAAAVRNRRQNKKN